MSAFVPKHFNMYFLRTRIFSYIITIQLSNPGNLISIQCYNLISSLYSNVAIGTITEIASCFYFNCLLAGGDGRGEGVPEVIFYTWTIRI